MGPLLCVPGLLLGLAQPAAAPALAPQPASTSSATKGNRRDRTLRVMAEASFRLNTAEVTLAAGEKFPLRLLRTATCRRAGSHPAGPAAGHGTKALAGTLAA